jgi:hypothetical protein
MDVANQLKILVGLFLDYDDSEPQTDFDTLKDYWQLLNSISVNLNRFHYEMRKEYIRLTKETDKHLQANPEQHLLFDDLQSSFFFDDDKEDAINI